MSNWSEATMLVTDEYQEKIATAVANGVEKHLGIKTGE